MKRFLLPETGRFFIRLAFTAAADKSAIAQAVGPMADALKMEWRLRDRSEKQRVMLMVSKFDHCLGDLLYEEMDQFRDVFPAFREARHPQRNDVEPMK